MAWQTITTDDVKTKVAGAELEALQSAALADSQADPLPEIVAAAVDEVRGYIAAASYILEDGQKVPSRLVNATLAIIRYRLATRLPGRSFSSEDRSTEYRDAVRLLERVAEGKFALEAPVTPDTEVSGGARPSFADRTRIATRETEDGL